MSRWIRMVLVCLCFGSGVLHAQETPAPDHPAITKEIDALRAGLVDAYNRKDMDRLLSYTRKDIFVTWQNGEVSYGHDAVRNYYTRMMTGENSVVLSLTCNPVVEGRHIFGDTAVSYGSLGDEFKLRDGMELPLNSRWSATLVKDQGRWLVASFHASANIFDNPVLRIAVKKTAYWTGGVMLVVGLILGSLITWFVKRPKPSR